MSALPQPGVAPPHPRRELRALTGLRGVAAVAVMAGHFAEHATLPPILRRMADATGHAVELFFILSGFILVMVYGRSVLGRGGIRHFLWQRLARLYPLYAVMTLLCFAIARAGLPLYGDPAHSALALLSNLLMVQQWAWPIDSLDGPGWSISTEWAANLLFPAAALCLLRGSARRALLAAALCAATVAVADSLPGSSYWDMPILLQWHGLRLPESMVTCAAEFIAGMACWRLRGLPAARVLGHDAALAAILAGMVLQEALDAPAAWFCTLAALLVVGLSQDRSALARLLGAPLLHGLGVISYSIYLVHAPMISLVPVLAAVPVRQPFAFATLVTMLAALAVATGTQRWIEQPAQRWLRERAWPFRVDARPPPHGP